MSLLDLTVEKIFMTGNLDTAAQLLFTIKRTVELTNCSIRETKRTGKYEIIFGKNDRITFPCEEIPSIVGFTGISVKHGVHVGYKINTATSNKLMKSDETKAYYGDFPADLCAGRHLIFIPQTLSSISKCLVLRRRYYV